MAYVDEFNLLLSEYHERIDIVFMNIDEYQALRCLPIPKTTVVVKKGAEGASFWRDGDWVSIPTQVISRVRTTTGAGDILAGTCLAGIASGIDFETAYHLSLWGIHFSPGVACHSDISRRWCGLWCIYNGGRRLGKER